MTELSDEVRWMARDGLSTPHAVLRELPGPPRKVETFCGYSIPVTPAASWPRRVPASPCRGCARLVSGGEG